MNTSTPIHNQSVTRKPCRFRLPLAHSTPYFLGINLSLRKYFCTGAARVTKYKSSLIKRIVNVIIFVMWEKVDIVGDYSRNPIVAMFPTIQIVRRFWPTLTLSLHPRIVLGRGSIVYSGGEHEARAVALCRVKAWWCRCWCWRLVIGAWFFIWVTKVRTLFASTVCSAVFVSKMPVLTPSIVDTRLVSSFIYTTVLPTIKTTTVATLSGTLAAWRSIVVGGPTRGLGW